MTDADRRNRLRAYYAECDRIRTEREAIELAELELLMQQGRYRRSQDPPLVPLFPPFPDELRGLACGAKTRAGSPCKIAAIYSNGRCKLHGGLSTGPRTVGGKARAALNGLTPKSKRTP